MEVILLDTDVFSFIFKGNNTWKPHYEELLLGKRSALSFMTVAELYHWAVFKNWGERRVTELERTIQTQLIFWPSLEICQQWAQLQASRRAQGRPISTQDAWHAAIALYYDIPLLTNNVKDYEGIKDLQLLTAPIVH